MFLLGSSAYDNGVDQKGVHGKAVLNLGCIRILNIIEQQ